MADEIPITPPPPLPEVAEAGKEEALALPTVAAVARDFKVKDAFVMLRNTIQRQKEFGIDALVEEDLSDDLEKVVFVHGYDKDSHPMCYNAFREFQNKELYQKTFSDEEKRTKFLRWQVQFLEKGIRKLDLTLASISGIFSGQ